MRLPKTRVISLAQLARYRLLDSSGSWNVHNRYANAALCTQTIRPRRLELEQNLFLIFGGEELRDDHCELTAPDEVNFFLQDRIRSPPWEAPRSGYLVKSFLITQFQIDELTFQVVDLHFIHQGDFRGGFTITCEHFIKTRLSISDLFF